MSPHSLTPPHPIIFTIIIIIILWSSYIRYVARKQTGWDSSADEERGDRPPSFFRLNIRHAKCHSANGHTFFGLLAAGCCWWLVAVAECVCPSHHAVRYKYAWIWIDLYDLWTGAEREREGVGGSGVLEFLGIRTGCDIHCLEAEG